MLYPQPQTPAFHDRDAAVAFLFGRLDYERTRDVKYCPESFKLERMRNLLEQLGHPEALLNIIHIAGTKGKGSTATMIAAALQVAGHRTGLYTSPHLNRIEERASINGVPCSERDFVELLSIIHDAVKNLDHEVAIGERSRGPTFFEITTAMALLHFARKQVDVAVIEVGLGGRLDSTNVCNPLVSVITNISFDHTKQLGETLAEIATEKAGIIKPGIPVVSGVSNPEARQVIRKAVAENRCELWEIDSHFSFRYKPNIIAQTRPAATMSFCNKSAGIPTYMEDVSVGLLGKHQAANAAVAIATLNQLKSHGFLISEEAIRHGLTNVRCPARFEVVGFDPTIIIDAAHNVASVEAFVDTLELHFPAQPRILVFATSRDKDAAGMLRRLLPHFEHVILTRYTENPRFVDPDVLLEVATKILNETGSLADRQAVVSVHEQPIVAWKQAVEKASHDSLLCVAGSSFIAGEIRRVLSKGSNER